MGWLVDEWIRSLDLLIIDIIEIRCVNINLSFFDNCFAGHFPTKVR